MKRFLYLTTALAAMLTLSAPVARAEDPSCPLRECGSNGPALDGHQIMLPDRLQIGGTSATERQRSVTSRTVLDSPQFERPDLAGIWIGPEGFPGDDWEIRPIDQRWPNAGRNWVQQ